MLENQTLCEYCGTSFHCKFGGSVFNVPLCWYRPKAINTSLNGSLNGALCAASVAKEPSNAGSTSGQM